MPLKLERLVFSLANHGTPLSARLKIESSASNGDAPVTDAHVNGHVLSEVRIILVDEAGQSLELGQVSGVHDVAIPGDADLVKHVAPVDREDVVVLVFLLIFFLLRTVVIWLQWVKLKRDYFTYSSYLYWLQSINEPIRVWIRLIKSHPMQVVVLWVLFIEHAVDVIVDSSKKAQMAKQLVVLQHFF